MTSKSNETLGIERPGSGRAVRTASLGALPALTLGAALISTAPAPAATYEIDGSHTVTSFSVRHMMISNVRGQFGETTGTIQYDGKSAWSIGVDATVDVASIDTREPKRDEHLKSPDFFDVAQYPTMTFRSKKAIPAGQDGFKLVGDLTIHGVTREVTFDVVGPTAEVKDPWGNVRVGATAAVTIDRNDFGLQWNQLLETGGVLVGKDVSITIEIEAIKAADDVE